MEQNIISSIEEQRFERSYVMLSNYHSTCWILENVGSSNLPQEEQRFEICKLMTFSYFYCSFGLCEKKKWFQILVISTTNCLITMMLDE